MRLRSFLFIVLGACAASYGHASEPAPLIEAFAPLRWSSRIEELRTVFPGATVQVVKQTDPERRLATASGAKTKTLGDVVVLLEVDLRETLRSIRYSSDDRRPECRLEGRGYETIPSDIDCGWRRGPRALATFRAWESRLRAQLGPPPEGVNKMPSGEITMKWPRKGYVVFLSLQQGEDGLWEVALDATRSDGRGDDGGRR
jgi:hypothetical protein